MITLSLPLGPVSQGLREGRRVVLRFDRPAKKRPWPVKRWVVLVVGLLLVVGGMFA